MASKWHLLNRLVYGGLVGGRATAVIA